MPPHDFKKFPELTNSQMETLYFLSPHMQITQDFRAEVIKVHDADTITLRIPERDFDFPLRFLGIDAPELNEGGETARDWLKSMIEGTEVDIKIDPNNRVGKYGRLLGRVFSMGMDLGEIMLMYGMVKSFDARNEGKIPDINQTLNIRQWL